MIGNPILASLDATEHSFHGMGREDIDVRCMGRGRPFVIELKEPKIRTCDYSKLQQMVNEQAAGAIEVTDLRSSNRSEVEDELRILQLISHTPYGLDCNP